MSSIVPPLDIIPKLPAKAVNLVIKQLDKQTDRLLEDVTKTVQNSSRLPANVNCDDPRVKQIKTQLASIQQQITKIQETIPRIQSTINTVNTVVATSLAIKATISAVQLSNPVTAPVFIAQQLLAIQDATIVNAIESLKQFSTVPETVTSKIATIVPPLLSSIDKLSNVCNGDVDQLTVPESVVTDLNSNYNDLVPTEFYTELNVSDEDLDTRSDVIQQLLEQQQNLLQSLQEAPSKVFNGEGLPGNDIGKPGDYYIDISTQTVYGPKPSQNSWT
jgi:division protein CdvB (Snf7/Vps24/ESCRT-III family)